MFKFLIMMMMISSTFASNIQAQIQGMVCDFCASTMETAFKKNANVQSVDINLKTKIITLELKPGKDLSDKEIKSIVTNQGYVVTKIDR